jgi:DNA replication and repair protein RecF
MVKTLRAIHFRCWKELSIEMPDSGAIFVGQNAQGKTSILEAVCVLLRLQSPRTHKLGTMVQSGERGFGIAGEAWEEQRKVRYDADGLICEVDQEARDTSAAYLRDGGLVVWMGNEDLELVRGSGEVRRRYLDFMGVQWEPEYRRHWSRYRRALKAKNTLLKERIPDDKHIAAYEEIMIESGDALAHARASMVVGLQQWAAESHQAVSIGDAAHPSKESISLEYRPAGSLTMRAALAQAYERERRTRQSVAGPHRDDLVLLLNGMPASDYASEGQQRTLALALKLAQGKLLEQRGGKMPLYLLDDIFGELDRTRRNALMKALPAHAQKWITTTSLDWLSEDSSYQALHQFQVAGGRIIG